MTYSFKQHFVICMILSAILAVGSCTCGSDESAGPHESAGGPADKTITILLCTANVHYLGDNAPNKVLEPLVKLRQETDDLVFVGLQEVPTGKLEDIKQAFTSYQVYDDDRKGGLANTLVVFNKLKLTINPIHIDLPIPPATVVIPSKNKPVGRRYATILHMPAINLKVANTHILGGRFDDAGWYLFPHIRNEQIKAILTDNPTIIMGDFNADNTPNVKIKQGGYWETIMKLGTGQGKDPVQVEADFRNYMFGLHAELVQQGYAPLLTEQDVEYTIKRGASQGIVDWIYGTKEFTQGEGYQVVDKGIIRAIDPKLSDHNFPWIRIRIKDPRQ